MRIFTIFSRPIVLALVLFAAFPLVAQEGSKEELANLTEAQRQLYEAGFGVPKKSTEAPDFTLKDLEGNSVTLSDLEGKVVLLNLWATWCPPCRREMPSMQELYDDLPRSGFTILAVAAPNSARESLEKIREHIEQNEYSFPVLLDEEMKVNSIYGTGSIPTSWIIGPEGKLQARLVGAREWNEEGIVSAIEMMMQ
jgi:peroxiredoxin